MAKKEKIEAVEAEDKRKVSVVHEGTTVNGHVLGTGTVIALSEDDIAKHRDAGVPLEDVSEDDESDVYDVSEPYEASEEVEKEA